MADNTSKKWICAFDTLCTGWDCIRDEDGNPALYDSKEEIENDDMFDPEEDFAIPEEEFIEGRKVVFYAGHGCRIEGKEQQ